MKLDSTSIYSQEIRVSASKIIEGNIIEQNRKYNSLNGRELHQTKAIRRYISTNVGAKMRLINKFHLPTNAK